MTTVSGPVRTSTLPGAETYGLPVAASWYKAHPGWFSAPAPATTTSGGRTRPGVPGAVLPVPEGTKVLAVTSGTVTSVRTTDAGGLTVVLHGDDQATYTYSHLATATAKAKQLVTTGEELGTSGVANETSGTSGATHTTVAELGFQIHVPDVSSAVCPQTAFEAWGADLAVDVGALPDSGCVSGTDPITLQRVLVVRDTDTAGVAAPLSTLLEADHVQVSALQLSQPLGSEAPPTRLPLGWPALVAAAVKAHSPSLVIMDLGQAANQLARIGPASIRGVLRSLPKGQAVLWVEPVLPDSAVATKTKTAGSPAPRYLKALKEVNTRLARQVRADPDLRVVNLDDLMAQHSSWLDGADTTFSASGIQGLSGALYAYVATSARLGGATRLAWATAFADQLSAPSLAAIEFVMAWTTEEGAKPDQNNPLNTTEDEPGAKVLVGNVDGVKTYPSLLTGLDANLAVIEDDTSYATIVADLQDGDTTAAAKALQASPWCVGAGGGECPGYGRSVSDIERRYTKAGAFDRAAASPAGTDAVAGYGVPLINESFLPVDQFLVAQLGKPYVWGGAGPGSWDCSGLVMAAYAKVGLVFEHNAALQYQETKSEQVKGGLSALRPGDLVFYAYNTSNPSSIHHVAVYVGDGQVLDAPYTGTVVQIQPVWSSGFYAATRPLDLLKG